MTEFKEDIAGVASGFAEIFSKAATGQNIEKLRIAEGTIRASTDAINLEKEVGRRQIARALALHTGTVSARQAATGGGVKGTGEALIDAATFQAADAAAVLEANAAAKEAAVIFANQPILEDPILAAIQGIQVGAEVGTSIAQSLLEEAHLFTTFGPFQGLSTLLVIPGFDIHDFIKDLGGP